MKDRLEEFVLQNKDAFDVYEPDPTLWLKVNPANIQEKKRGRALQWMRYAAAAAVIFAAVSSGIFFLGGAHQSRMIYGELQKEITEAEAYYSALVSQTYNELQPYFTSAPGLKEELDYDLNELDEIYIELKDDLKDNVGNPEVIEAMIQQYRMKVEILQDLLNQLKVKESQDYEKANEYSL